MVKLYEVKDLSFAYNKRTPENFIFKDFSLEVEKNDYIAILAPSGIGKSTLIHLLTGLLRPSSGEIYFKGKDFLKYNKNELARYRLHDIGIVFQEQNLLNHLSVFENIEYPLGLAGINKSDRHMRVDQLMDQFNIKHLKNHRANNISGGEKKRVSIARALANSPDTLFIDEPVTGLDEKNRNNILDYIDALHTRGISIILSTHFEKVYQKANRVIELENIRSM